MTNTTDIFATLASIVGYDLPSHVAVDSYDMSPALFGLQPDNKPIRPHADPKLSKPISTTKRAMEVFDHQGSGGNNYDRETCGHTFFRKGN